VRTARNVDAQNTDCNMRVVQKVKSPNIITLPNIDRFKKLLTQQQIFNKMTAEDPTTPQTRRYTT